MIFSTASTTPSLTRIPIAVLAYRPCQTFSRRINLGQTLSSPLLCWHIRPDKEVYIMTTGRVRAPDLTQTWKMRPSGEYVLADRSYPVPMDVMVNGLAKGDLYASAWELDPSGRCLFRTSDMNDEEGWSQSLQDHPIFTRSRTFDGLSGNAEWSLELSTRSLPVFTTTDILDDAPTPSGRRKTMALKDADLIVAVGKEIRMTSLGIPKPGQSTAKSYKVRTLYLTRWRKAVTVRTGLAHPQYPVRNPPNRA